MEVFRIKITDWHDVSHNCTKDVQIDVLFYQIRDYASRDDYRVILTDEGKDTWILSYDKESNIFNESQII
ncbi:MAG: hypothetical protein P9M05_05325 [Candidatus Stygibacter australis]|nr:hypothetical protein [Candidatus Stygibacter australis]